MKIVNKIGTGTQYWQLYNLTDAAQITVISDTGAAGDKYLTTTVANALTGVKRVRIRVYSTTAGDDPVYYGGAVRLY